MLDSSLNPAENINSVIAITEIDHNEKSVIGISGTDGIDIYRTMSIPNTADFPAVDFLAVPFTHHSRILSKAKDLQERCYYIRRCAQEHLSVDTLVRLMEDDAYQKQQSLPDIEDLKKLL